jgi:hypothetical protein
MLTVLPMAAPSALACSVQRPDADTQTSGSVHGRPPATPCTPRLEGLDSVSDFFQVCYVVMLNIPVHTFCTCLLSRSMHTHVHAHVNNPVHAGGVVQQSNVSATQRQQAVAVVFGQQADTAITSSAGVTRSEHAIARRDPVQPASEISSLHVGATRDPAITIYMVQRANVSACPYRT